MPGRVAQSVGHLTRKSGVLGSIPGLATYFRFSFRFIKKDSCQLLAFWLVGLGLTALSDSISVYIGPSPRERERGKRSDK